MVLLVESDFAYAEKVRGALQKLGVPVHVVTDGLEALRWLRSNTPQLILADQSVPWVDAFRLCRLTKFHKRYAQVPFLILTMVADEPHRRLADLVRSDGYLEKGWDVEGVVQEANRLLSATRASGKP